MHHDFRTRRYVLLIALGTTLALGQGCSDKIDINEEKNTDTTANMGVQPDQKVNPRETAAQQKLQAVDTETVSGTEMPDRQTILEFKNKKGEELRTQYGAHALGIGWKLIDGVKTDELALVFYVRSATVEPASTIPPYFEFERASDGTSVFIPTTVRETPQAQEEKI